MPGRPDCDACDFRDRPETCHAMALGSSRLCELAHRLGRVDYRDLIRRMTAGEEASPDVRAQVREALAVNRCKVRQAIGCGCADRSALCFRSGLPVAVTRERCGACVAPMAATRA